MKLFTKKDKRTNLEKEIDSVIENLEDLNEDSDEYKKSVESLEKLVNIYEKLNSSKKSNWLSKDMIAYLLGLGLILGFEKANVITTKALGFVVKGRV